MYLKKYVPTGSIVLNPDVFDPDYVPDILPFREGQLDAIAREIAYFVRGGVRTNLFLHGPPGTGKTASVRRILRDIAAVFPSVRTAYVNAWKFRTRAGVLGEIATRLGVAVPVRGVAAESIVRSLEAFVEEHKSVIVIDEADRLAGSKEVLYDLSRLGSNAFLITISNSKEFLSLLDPRITSTLFQSSIEFPRYTVPELTEILRQRASLGLRPGSYSEDVLRACAAVGFARGGDARAAISCLINAAKRAEERGAGRISLDDVRAVKDSISPFGPIDPRLRPILDILSREGPLTVSKLYELYSKEVPVTDRTFRNYLRKLYEMGLIGMKRARVRGNVRIVYLKR